LHDDDVVEHECAFGFLHLSRNKIEIHKEASLSAQPLPCIIHTLYTLSIKP
jgi:hypothetical protein